jgi:hypothetical protein
MNNLSLSLDKFDSLANQFLDYATQNKMVKLVLAITILLYGNLAAPAFPKQFLWIFDNFYFKVAFLSFIAWTSHHDPLLGIVTSVLFLISVDLINKNKTENFKGVMEGPQSAVYPGCLNIKASDLLESFDGNNDELLNAMIISRVPYDVKVDDMHAPIIATHLLNHGFALKSPCSFPTINENIGY